MERFLIYDNFAVHSRSQFHQEKLTKVNRKGKSLEKDSYWVEAAKDAANLATWIGWNRHRGIGDHRKDFLAEGLDVLDEIQVKPNTFAYKSISTDDVRFSSLLTKPIT